jgi:hypothetical protein
VSSPYCKSVSAFPSGKSPKPVQPRFEKFSASQLTQIISTSPAVQSRHKGRFAIVTNAGLDAVDVAASGAQMGSQGGFP